MPMNRALKYALVDRGMTQVVLAKRVRIHESRLSRIIRGHDSATDDEKQRLARGLKRPVGELFPGDIEQVAS